MGSTAVDSSNHKDIRIVVRKKQRKLELFAGEKLVRSYRVVLGFAPMGIKETEGDGKTPEGEFYVYSKNPNSKYHLSLGISYPSVADAKRALGQNLITQEEHDSIGTAVEMKELPLQKTALGGEIYIHGGGIAEDWTGGCIAVSNEDMTEIFDAISLGAKITILA
jgi:murein L,D-transpeptidase YafK